DSIKVSHALVAYAGAERADPAITRSHEEAKLRSDTLMDAINKDPNQFVLIARGASDDRVAASKDEDLGWINKDTPFDEQFKAGAFFMDKDSVKVVESKFGFHVIKVMDVSKSKKPRVQVATVERKLEPSQKTFDKIYQQAQAFAANNRTAAQFDSSVA